MAGLMKQNLFYFSFDLKFAEDKHKMSDVLTDKISVKNPFFYLITNLKQRLSDC